VAYALEVIEKIKESDKKKKDVVSWEEKKAKKKDEDRQRKEEKKVEREAEKLTGEALAAFLALPAKAALANLLEGSGPIAPVDLALKYSALTGLGFAKHYERKMNHILNEFPDLFKKPNKVCVCV
jgi:hypothetical protein